MARETKKMLLAVGKKIFSERGYKNSGIEAILKAADVPKGSFYNYFDSKEDFGIQVIDDFAECHATDMNSYFADRSHPPLERFRLYYESKITRLETEGCRNGCLVGRLSQEMADQSEAFRSRLEQVFASWIGRYAACLAEAQEAGEIPQHLDVRKLAEFWLICWQGAILRAKSARDTAPLRFVLDTFLGVVLQTGMVVESQA